MNDTLSREATLPFSILPVFPKGVSWVMGGGGGGSTLLEKNLLL